MKSPEGVRRPGCVLHRSQDSPSSQDASVQAAKVRPAGNSRVVWAQLCHCRCRVAASDRARSNKSRFGPSQCCIAVCGRARCQGNACQASHARFSGPRAPNADADLRRVDVMPRTVGFNTRHPRTSSAALLVPLRWQPDMEAPKRGLAKTRV